MSAASTIDEWYAAHGCTHAHCPHGHEHPQPWLTADGRLVCGYCSVLEGRLVDMVPCTPAVCGERPLGRLMDDGCPHDPDGEE